MLFTITTTYQPATDLGYLLHKHPAKLQTFPLSFGQAHVFYPETSEERCTAALLLDIDPIQMFRQRNSTGKSHFSLQQYVNDRPYVVSSFLSVAIAEVYGTALAGNCKTKPDLVEKPLPLQAKLAVVPSDGGEAFIRQLFEPLGYTVSVNRHPLDEKFPEWGASNLFTVDLSAQIRLKDLLSHIYVLAPVLDDNKHYFVGEAEVDKLLARGTGWLQQHPLRELITERYLRHRRNLTQSALERLVAEEIPNLDEKEDAQAQQEISVETNTGLNQQRLDAVMDVLQHSSANRILDLGCGEGKLLRLLIPNKQFTEIVGMDVSPRSLEKAEKRLQLDRMPDVQRKKLRLIQGSLLYRDARLAGFDAAVLLEVIEHIEPSRLDVVEKVVFGNAKPEMVIVTTPNREYNRLWPSLPAGQFRHPDHHFEWDRAEFWAWANRVANTYGYSVSFYPVGPENSEAGAPTQMGVFIQ
ncbi:MAG: 3' terminal RNA ribose 2'-O-methyltransferase Hen1 [Chloroflexota bacterium]